MIGKVTVWKMTEEERLAYIEKHPIVPYEGTGQTFARTFSEKKFEKMRATAAKGGQRTKEKWEKERLKSDE